MKNAGLIRMVKSGPTSYIWELLLRVLPEEQVDNWAQEIIRHSPYLLENYMGKGFLMREAAKEGWARVGRQVFSQVLRHESRAIRVNTIAWLAEAEKIRRAAGERREVVSGVRHLGA